MSTNLVNLTPEEHYVVHQLLAKMYPDNEKLALAALIMTSGLSGRANKLYGWIKRRIAAARKGVPITEAVRKKISAKMAGENHPNWGKKNSEYTKAKRLISLSNRAKISYVKSDEAKNNHSLGAKASYASGRKKSTAGIKYSEASKKRMRENWHASRGLQKMEQPNA